MAVNENIVTGRKFRKLVDEVNKIWQRISFWTKASDVEFDDAKTAETKVGAIDGITDSLASTSSRIAASAKSVNQLNNNLTFPDGTKFYPDKQNGKYGFNTDPNRGADTFSPFKGTILYLGNVVWTHYTGKTNTYNFTQAIINAGLNPSDYTADNIFFRPKSTTYRSYTSSNNTLNRAYTYTNGVITTTSGYVGDMYTLDVTDLCYLVV